MKAPVQITLINLIAAVFIFLFVYTGLNKLFSFNSFRDTIEQSPLIKDYAFLIAWILPIVELTISILLFVPATRLAGFYSSLALMIVFTVYIAYMLLTQSNLPCSCGGILKQLSWKQHLIFNILFTLSAALSIKLMKQRKKQIAFV